MPAPHTPPEKRDRLHPRNRHQGHYDFPALIRSCPELGTFVIRNPHGKPSIDFASPEAVRVFNRALLLHFYQIRYWELPEGYLCPPVPGRADYLHGLADLLAGDAGRLPRGPRIRLLDIGTGANCIYPLIGHHEYGWSFTGSDIDPGALANAATIIRNNRLEAAIQLRRQPCAHQILQQLLQDGDYFHATLCNPPFHASAEEARNGSRRKWRNLGKQDPARRLPLLNFGGQHHELWCKGGELGFVLQLAEESQAFARQAGWFSTLVSKGGHLAPLTARLKRQSVRALQTVDTGQGQKRSRFVSWSYLSASERRQQLGP